MSSDQPWASRVLRLDALKALLAERDYTTVADLAEELGVSTRTLHRDLALLREMGVPVEGDRGSGGGLHLERYVRRLLYDLPRTGVEYDYRGDVIDAHAPEMPTRFGKQLAQIVRGGISIGVHRRRALNLALRCARDSMPPLRLAIVLDIAANPDSATRDVRQRLNKPRATVDRQLQALHMLEVLGCEEEQDYHRGQPVTIWRYRLADGIDPNALNSVPEMLVGTPRPQE
jgi:predicted transcriptional regulator